MLSPARASLGGNSVVPSVQEVHRGDFKMRYGIIEMPAFQQICSCRVGKDNEKRGRGIGQPMDKLGRSRVGNRASWGMRLSGLVSRQIITE